MQFSLILAVGQKRLLLKKQIATRHKGKKIVKSRTTSYSGAAEEDKLAVARARRVQRFLSQPFHVAEQFTGIPGVLVSIDDTIKGFNMILDGELDHLPEAAFNLVGTIEEAIEKGEKMLAEV